MPPSATSKSPAKSKLSPVKLDPPTSSAVTPTKPEKVIIKSKNNVLESTSPNSQLAAKLDALSLSSPSHSPTKRVYHASPAKENRVPQTKGGEKLQITLRPPEDDSPGMSEHAKKSLRSINALRGLTIDEIEIINKPEVKRLATVTQLCLSFLFIS
jgi:cell cycle protein kinase DBF2